MTVLTDSAFRSYLQTALWSSMDESNPQGGEPLDKNYDVDDFNDREAQEQKAECEQFIRDNEEAIDFLLENGHRLEKIMHDFWLTRNRHGAGFWNGDYPEPNATQLTKSAHIYGSVDPYVGDDDILYFS